MLRVFLEDLLARLETFFVLLRLVVSLHPPGQTDVAITTRYQWRYIPGSV